MAIAGEQRKPTRPSREEVAAFLAGYGLAPPVGPVRMLRAGEDNLNLRVSVPGEDLVLRRYDKTPPDEVLWELQVVDRLGSAGFPTPGVLRRPDGGVIGQLQGRPAAIFRFVRGVHPLRYALWAGEQVAGALARLGTLTAGTAGGSRSRTDVWRLERVREVAALGGTTDPELPEFLSAVERALSTHHQHQAAWSGLPRGVIHHDAHEANVLFDDQRRLVALLDFDEAFEDCLLTDVARLLRFWGINGRGGGIDPAGASRPPPRCLRAGAPPDRFRTPVAPGLRAAHRAGGGGGVRDWAAGGGPEVPRRRGVPLVDEAQAIVAGRAVGARPPGAVDLRYAEVRA